MANRHTLQPPGTESGREVHSLLDGGKREMELTDRERRTFVIVALAAVVVVLGFLAARWLVDYLTWRGWNAQIAAVTAEYAKVKQQRFTDAEKYGGDWVASHQSDWLRQNCEFMKNLPTSPDDGFTSSLIGHYAFWDCELARLYSYGGNHPTSEEFRVINEGREADLARKDISAALGRYFNVAHDLMDENDPFAVDYYLSQ